MTVTAATAPWKNKAVAPKVDPIKALIDELGALRTQKSTIEKREKELTEAIKPLGAGEHNGNKCIAAIDVSERETFQSKEFKSDHPELAARYIKTSTVTTIRIKALV